ncbi:glycosyltransferase [Pseudarthrobacter phenanthrenivorans Sphe3]|uniref:Glycosyltransferase n=1 Tax=Pseudarthrobacter phenanthrenivorans (strain DSM 18606 / JCM 16027 / LMG 23796 / Sphe3) TaxID=930171 RepID=F0MA50_PSEPM|nr:exopolysaccharide biosynthesis GT4 family glycosyltransferase EpsE [Pseudarthrobacter phenanthrenivorans]ADX75037.1 glycosyltransferase [Pseudarthrobacter phenanthrenivorans Sphe3]
MTTESVPDALRLGYLVPEFPGQTHGFFWRELGVLKQLGVSPGVVSTRHPGRNASRNDWGEHAASITPYLASVSVPAFLSCVRELRALTPGRLAEVLRHAARMSKVGDRAPRFARPRGFITQLVWLALGARLSGLAREQDWQHVHVHSCGNAAYIALYARLLSGLPYSLTLHGPLADYGGNQEYKWSNAAFALVITEQLEGQVRQSLRTALPTVRVAPMGVDVNVFKRSQPYVPWTAPGTFRIFSCGRLNPSKGHDVLLAAVRMLVENGADVQLVIAGEDEAGGRGYRQVIERLIDNMGLQDRVRLLGCVPDKVIRQELSLAHVFTLASHAEPLGVAIMEAMSMGLPVVATAAGGVSELVVPGRTGVLVKSGDPGSLAEGLVQLMGDPLLCANMGQAGRQRATTLFSYRRSAEVLVQMARAGVVLNAEPNS